MTDCRTFTTQTKNPGAVVVGRLPDREEEDRGGRQLEDTEDTGRSPNRKKKFVKLLRYLLEQVK